RATPSSASAASDVYTSQVLELGTAAAATSGAKAAEQAAPLLAGNLAFKGALRYYAPNLTFRQVSLAFTPLAGLVPRELAPLQLTGEGALDLASLGLRLAEARLATPQARLTLTGEGKLAPPAFAGEFELTGSLRKLAALAGLHLAAGADESVALSSRLDLSGASLRLQGLKGTLGGTSLGGELALTLPTDSAAAPTLAGSLRLGAIDLGAWLDGAETPPTTAPPGAPRKPDAPAPAANTQKTPGTKAANSLPGIDLGLNVAALRHGGLGVAGVTARITGKAGRYMLGDLSGRLVSGGALAGSLGVDVGSSAYTLTARGTGVDIAGLCAAMGNAGVASGVAAFDARLRAQGAGSAALLASLGGEGELEARDIGAPALSEGARVLKGLAPGLTLPERIERLRAPFSVRGGVVTARPVTATAAGMAARGEARLDLVRETVDGRATLSALGLDIPLDFKGPFDAVKVSVDPRFGLELARKLGGLKQLPGAGAKSGSAPPESAIREGIGAAGGRIRGLFGR
ncbi:MAG: AsmA-like C-terminal region-containing protein, partial [Desulfovibrio sp.]|nr:AsmA-like C-terminal region-containing protein [Desulfovibrio sp.]